MRQYRQKENCCGCSACAEICPEGAVSMAEDREGFRYPKVNQHICTDCGRCETVCPLKGRETAAHTNLYMGAQAKDERIRSSGSSGGVFSVLAEYVLRRRGIVYGAGFDRDMNVVHKRVEDPDQLEEIKRTKYVQSDTEGIYGKIEKDLQEGRWVLFCGTPCQAQALMLFLQKTYERLIVADLVCYGVPSPGVWKDYIRYLERKHGGKVTGFSFRDKRNGDNGQMRSYEIDGREYTAPLSQDVFCRMFFRNYILRPSCHSCKFCTVNRNSDFTIGDFWGIERVRPDMDDGFGTSLVIVHSEQAKRIWDEIKEELRWFACDEDAVMQPRLREPSAPARGRLRFWLLYRAAPFWLIVKRIGRSR